MIDYVPGSWLVESKSLKLYMGSFRNHGAFHEDCTIAIAKRLIDFLAPKYLRIGGYWYPRGGIPIDIFYQSGALPDGVWLRLPVVRDGLARAYYANGDLDKAIAEYQQLTTFDPKSKDRFLIDPKHHYRLGKLYEEKGWPGLAMQEYEKFLDICRDADSGLPELLEAKARFAKLKGMPASLN